MGYRFCGARGSLWGSLAKRTSVRLTTSLRAMASSMLPTPNVHVEALLPYTAGSLMSRVREYGKVINVEYRDDGMMLEAEVDDQLAAQIVEQAID